jgi:hypothetical protein
VFSIEDVEAVTPAAIKEDLKRTKANSWLFKIDTFFS